MVSVVLVLNQQRQSISFHVRDFKLERLTPSFAIYNDAVYFRTVNSKSDNWNDNLQSFNRKKNEASVPVFSRIGRQFQSLERQVYADWTSVSFPLCQRSCLIWRTMANNDDEYNDEYNDEYLCRDFFVGFNFWSTLSFQISEFRVHCFRMTSVLTKTLLA